MYWDRIYGLPVPNPDDQKPWSLFSRYGHVLLYIHRNPDVRMREIALGLGLTERAVQMIVLRLEKSGTLVRNREGRNNRYALNYEQKLPDLCESNLKWMEILDLALKNFEADELTTS